MSIKIKRKVSFKSEESLYKWLKQGKHVYRETIVGPYRLHNGIFQHANNYGWYTSIHPMPYEIDEKLFYKYV